MADCLQNIVGLTDKDCGCYEADKPEGFDSLNLSSSGYFITDPEFGFPVMEEIDLTGGCGDGTIWEKLIRAREKALLAFRTDLSAAMASRYRNKLQTKETILGKLEATTSSDVSSAYAGLGLYPKPFRDAKFILEAVYLGLNVATDVTFHITSNMKDISGVTPFTDQTFTLTTVAGKFTRKALDTPLEMPFFSKYNSQNLRYYVAYEVPEGAKVLANKFYCCGNRPSWFNFMGITGFQYDSLEDIPVGGSFPYGMALEGYFSCDEIDWLCRMDTLAGYTTESVVGRAIQHKAAAILISDILASSKINRFTLKPKEELWGRRKYLNGEYTNAVQWIASNLPPEATDCLECQPQSGFRKSSILV